MSHGKNYSLAGGNGGKKKEPRNNQLDKPAAWYSRPALLPALVFFICFGAYVSNGDFLYGFDQEGNMLMSVNILKRQSLTVNAEVAPRAFAWVLNTPGEAPRNVTGMVWERKPDEMFPRERLSASNRYHLTQTTRPGEFANTFGLGTALVGVPVYALLDQFTDIEADQFWWWHGAALTASLLTAFTALLIFLTARRFVAPLPAVLVALAFGLGSCAWAVSSQALWQHPANSFFLALAAWFLLDISSKGGGYAAGCGAALGMAVLCRPTSAVVVICVGAYLLWINRRWFAHFVLAGLPFAIILAVYNGYYFGSPLTFGQTIASMMIFEGGTGSASLWQGSWSESLPGLFISPEKGLAWHSPVLLFGFVGVALAWKTPHYRPLLPLLVSSIGLVLIAGKWTDWRGGASFGYRSIVDITPFLALFMLPLIERVVAGYGWRILFGAALLWSTSMQFIGAYTYSVSGWSDYSRDNPDKIDQWSLVNSSVVWHINNFKSQREAKKNLMAWYTGVKTQVLYVPEPK